MRKIFVLLLLSAAACIFAEPVYYCSEDTVCLGYDTRGTAVFVYLKNQSPYAGVVTTVTLEGTLANMKSDKAFPFTATLTGTVPVLTAVLEAVDPSKDWNYEVYFYWTFGSIKAGPPPEPLRLPFRTGESYRVGQGFNGKATHFGEIAYALDWDMPEGTAVTAMRDGYVIKTVDGFTEGGYAEEFKNKSNFIMVQHADGTVAEYQHLKAGGLAVTAGQQVKAGDVIGYSGNTGYSSNPHLHVQVSRPLSGRQNESLPVMFRTSLSDGEVPVESREYFQPEDGRREAKLPVGYESLVLCRSIQDDMPRDITGTFSGEDTINVFIPILKPDVYNVKVVLSKDGNGSPLVYQWKTGSTWRYCYAAQYLREIVNPAGEWKADVYIDGSLIKSQAFSVR
ncbi:MAG: M23 family metallopeptidase [Spirochaetales bacterium]|nr:MAG: M23 family metallopeptidase [Spirochaetales bacterium]